MIASTLAQNNQPPSSQRTVKHPDRRQINLSGTVGKWAFFKNEWELYKRHTKFPESSSGELRGCCSQELRHELFNYVGSSVIDGLNESKLLDHICRLAVKGKNAEVHRREFYTLHQEPGMPAQQFIAQLCAKVEHCTFKVTCPSCSLRLLEMKLECRLND